MRSSHGRQLELGSSGLVGSQPLSNSPANGSGGMSSRFGILSSVEAALDKSQSVFSRAEANLRSSSSSGATERFSPTHGIVSSGGYMALSFTT